jgi:hypothetical protein
MQDRPTARITNADITTKVPIHLRKKNLPAAKWIAS